MGLILFADKVYKVIPPQKGRKHILAIISTILTAVLCTGRNQYRCSFRIYDGCFQKEIFGVSSDFADDLMIKLLKIASKKHQLLRLESF